jgi:hypothetical protein
MDLGIQPIEALILVGKEVIIKTKNRKEHFAL